ncbi:hypothetical protein KP79_PYT10281 [Mizuhopecten yessoensis]|uniref:CARD domain-containing protein n=1 Tax=Mizuhopecten yessoensis TaxID=6573 RepID=A0A210Q9V2_MIZYE|nr:hypothetical protein KP79_PYT10281 [Mizuhopecten yessoensis]
MYSSQKEALRRNHVSIMDQLDPKDVSDHLHQDGVLTESDHELIDTGKTRKERCWMLLGILPSRGPVAYNSFKNALKHGYSHLEKLLSETTSSNGKVKDACLDSPYHFGSIGICAKCQPYMPANIASPALQNVLHKSCCMVLQNVEASDLLDLLYQEAILERNDCELIKSENTRKDRCVVLISKLSQCAKSYVSTVFTESLRRKYSFITDMLDNVNKEVSEGSLHLRSSPINDERPSYPTHHTGIHRVLEVKQTELFYQPIPSKSPMS